MSIVEPNKSSPFFLTEEILCKYCDGQNIEFKKSWSWKSGRSGIELETELWYCRECKKTFRVNRRIF